MTLTQKNKIAEMRKSGGSYTNIAIKYSQLLLPQKWLSAIAETAGKNLCKVCGKTITSVKGWKLAVFRGEPRTLSKFGKKHYTIFLARNAANHLLLTATQNGNIVRTLAAFLHGLGEVMSVNNEQFEREKQYQSALAVRGFTAIAWTAKICNWGK